VVSEIREESGSLLEPVTWSLAIDMQMGNRRKTKKTYIDSEEWFGYRKSKRFQRILNIDIFEKQYMPMQTAKR